MKALPIIVFLTMIILLGCVGEQPKGKGIIIDSFEADSALLRPGDELTINAKITNQGDVVAEKIYGEILNTADLKVTGGMKKTVSKLHPEEDAEFSWVMQIPEDLAVRGSYMPKMRLCYVYRTISYQDVFVAGNNWNGEVPEMLSGTNRGVVDMSFEVNRLYDEKENAFLKINVHNDKVKGFVGNDTISDSYYGAPEYVKTVVLTIPKMGGRINMEEVEQPHFDCVEGVDEFTCTTTDVKLISGTDKSLKAVFNVAPLDDFDEASGRLNAFVVYRYCTDSPQISIVAQPRY
ncbi:MAG: hypothetical protein GOU97_04605 [Nanoarchaeota archaeon]|nr:hypothetical protein [Nanoarchaeota archaeon]